MKNEKEFGTYKVDRIFKSIVRSGFYAVRYYLIN